MMRLETLVVSYCSFRPAALRFSFEPQKNFPLSSADYPVFKVAYTRSDCNESKWGPPDSSVRRIGLIRPGRKKSILSSEQT